MLKDKQAKKILSFLMDIIKTRKDGYMEEFRHILNLFDDLDLGLIRKYYSGSLVVKNLERQIDESEISLIRDLVDHMMGVQNGLVIEEISWLKKEIIGDQNQLLWDTIVMMTDQGGFYGTAKESLATDLY